MVVPETDAHADRLLRELHEALARSKGKVTEIEVGIPLSIALGRQRPVSSCGGCAVPLSFEGVPARTNARLREPFRLIGSEPGAA